MVLCIITPTPVAGTRRWTNFTHENTNLAHRHGMVSRKKALRQINKIHEYYTDRAGPGDFDQPIDCTRFPPGVRMGRQRKADFDKYIAETFGSVAARTRGRRTALGGRRKRKKN